MDAQKISKVSALNKFHRKIVKIIFAADIVNRDDVGMLESLTNSSLPLKAGHRCRIRSPAIAEQLHGHCFLTIHRLSTVHPGKST